MIRSLVAGIGMFVLLAHPAGAAGFGCKGKLTTQERLICGDKTLSALDYRLSALYSAAGLIARPAESLRSTQRDWIQYVRAKCTDVPCLTAAYRDRIDGIMKIVLSSASHFPLSVKGRIQHRATDSPYCSVSGKAESGDGDWFSIVAYAKGQSVTGTIDGIFDCGRKVWGDLPIKGRLVGNVGLVEFQPGFDSDEGPPAEALIVITRDKIYWRVLSEIQRESYVPEAEEISIKHVGH